MPQEEHVFEFAKTIETARGDGETRFAITPLETITDTLAPHPTFHALADAFVMQQGMTPLGLDWVLISRSEALFLLTRVLSQDLAYHSRLLHHETAEALADTFLSFFTEEALYFTNGSYHIPPQRTNGNTVRGASWIPITRATFDTGVIAIDEDRIGLLWVLDED
jgi:hypothetical protein